MRTWIGEMRSGVVAGLTAALVLVAVTSLRERFSMDAVTATVPVATVGWRPPVLADPVASARAAARRGDRMLLAVKVGDSLTIPGISVEEQRRVATAPVRAITPLSVGLFGDDWTAFLQNAIPHAAAYNAVLLLTPSPRAPTS